MNAKIPHPYKTKEKEEIRKEMVPPHGYFLKFSYNHNGKIVKFE